MSLLMIKQYVHLKTLQRHEDSDGRLNNIIVKSSKILALLNAKLVTLKLNVSISLLRSSLGELCMLKISLENDYLSTENEPLEAFQRSIWRKPYTAFST